MSRAFTSHKCLTAAAVLAALTIVWAASRGTTTAQAQTTPYIRTFSFGPVTVGPDQSFLVSYSNLLGSRPYAVRAHFFDASTGQLLRTQEGVVAPGAGVDLTPVCPNCMNLAASASGPASIVGVVELADPRPTPVVSLQIVSAGRVVALADPRPTP